ncbi:MAG: LuxR C-terminal-related transcriptional regulator, partial [Sporichthyaceae bacterium]
AVHTGEVELRDEGNYFGPAIIRCARIRAVAHGGQIVCSRATADLAADDLPAEVGLLDLGSHRLKDLGRPEQIFEVTHPLLPGGFPALRSLDVVPNNLPAQLTSFVGRGRELAEIRRLLDVHRLVTLTGSGGCGKTRLAAALAADLAGEYADGAWWIELAPLADGTRVAGDVLTALRVQDAHGRPPLQQLVAHLSPRSLLLVLDNCEHLLQDCATLAEALLRGCPGVRVLATSRERLDLPGELAWRVPPMGLPSDGATPESVALNSYDAVALFVERAVGARPNFAVTNEIAPAVAQLCARLDGIPLAIELAAARTRVMTVPEILAALSDRFRLLTGGSRNLMLRQQTLEASVAWSHDLLDADERTLLRRLSVFAGGFTLSAVEAVCADENLAALRVLDLLDALVAKSLVVLDAEHVGTSRFRLLETVRAFAARKLDEAGETAAVRDAHLRHYLDAARAAESALVAMTRTLLERVAVDVDNHRAAIEWALVADDPDPALRLARHLGFLQLHRGRGGEALEWTDRALARHGGTPAARGWAHWVDGYARWHRGDIHGVIGCANLVLDYAEESGDDMLRGRGHQLRYCHRFFTDPDAVRESTQDAALSAGRSGDVWLQMLVPSTYATDAVRRDRLAEAWDVVGPWRAQCSAVGNDCALAWVAGSEAYLLVRGGNVVRAREVAAEGVALARDVGEPVVAAYVGHLLAEADLLGGSATDAIAGVEDLIRWNEGVGSEVTIPGLTSVAGRAHWAAGDEATALLRLRQGVAVGRRVGDALFVESAAVSLARLLIARGEWEEAGAIDLDAVVAAARSAGGNGLVADVAEVRAFLAAANGDHASAEDLHHRALALRHTHDYPVRVPNSLTALAGCAATGESWAEVARLLGAAAALWASFAAVPDPLTRLVAERTETAARNACGDEAFRSALEAGSALHAAEAVAYASRARGERGRPSSGWASLTPTELDVARLAACGNSNAEIGKQLFISAHTAKVHLSHIYTKLGLANRAELAAEVTRREG